MHIMTEPRFVALPTDAVHAVQAGAVDANGQPPERHISDGEGNPCRHCLTDIAKGAPFLILGWRPFPAAQPYAEVGPIFLHADACERHAETTGAPDMFLERDRLLVRGYGADDRIVYGSGQNVKATDLSRAAAIMLDRPEIAYVHVRSEAYNCYQCRIERA